MNSYLARSRLLKISMLMKSLIKTKTAQIYAYQTLFSQLKSKYRHQQIEMKLVLEAFLSLLFIISCANSSPIFENIFNCMSTQFHACNRSLDIIFTPQSSLYSQLLQSPQQNLRWVNSTTSNKPILIITPSHECEIQAAVLCSKNQGLQVRIRSGGHDYEGLSYLCQTQFIIIDLRNFRALEVDIAAETAWVQSGATLGELYYGIGKASRVHGFPAGICPTVGVGGHFSGGGFGTLLRKYGLAADNVVDARLIDVNGRILDRGAMGEDLFWAIRGGGGASFGVIISWKIKLVKVPPVVSVFTVSRTIEQGATALVNRWQYIADKLHEDLFIRIIIQNVGGGASTNPKTVQASFNSLFLGEIDRLIQLMNQNFPELGLKAADCTEMTWVESTIYIAGFPKGSPLEVLLDKHQLYKASFKAKSDYITQTIPEDGLTGIWMRFLEEERVYMIMDPYGGRMNDVLESETPFPHRKGNLYNVQYIVKWDLNEVRESNKHIHWIRMLHRYMTPYASKSPRSAYFNYRDLDLGSNRDVNTSYMEASVWGVKYFKGNFKRLVQVKSKIDPHNFFRDEQSIPSLDE